MQSTPQKSTFEESYFSETLKWTVTLGGLMLSAYLIAKTGYAWITIFLVLLSLILFSTKYILQIDAGEKLITDSFQVLWIKIKTRKFVYHELKCIRLEKQHYA